MNRAFEAALTARLCWIDVLMLEGLDGYEHQAQAAMAKALEAVEQLAWNDAVHWQHYGANVPPLLHDVPSLAEHYARAYECYLEAEREHEQIQKEWEIEQAYQQHLQDLADTYAYIEAELVAGWKEDCEQDGPL